MGHLQSCTGCIILAQAEGLTRFKLETKDKPNCQATKLLESHERSKIAANVNNLGPTGAAVSSTSAD